MPKFLTCFSSSPLSSSHSPISTPTTEGKPVGCVFCDVSKENGFDIVFEDETYIAFRDRFPQAKEHILIIPREHVGTPPPLDAWVIMPINEEARERLTIVGSVRQLTPSHLGMIREMDILATTISPLNSKRGFHIPPFSSIPHLHLHVFVPPFTALGRLMFPVTGSPERKGWGWFVTAGQVEGALQRGERIRLRRGRGA